MKKIIFLLILLAFALSAQARQGGNFGLGVVVGEPTGLCLKKWMGRTNAISGTIAFGHSYHDRHYYDHYWNDAALYLQASYLWHNYTAIPLDGGAAMPLYAGVGGRLIAGDYFQMGARMCGGVSIIPASIPFDFFLELGVIVDIFEDPGVGVDAGLGARFYF